MYSQSRSSRLHARIHSAPPTSHGHREEHIRTPPIRLPPLELNNRAIIRLPTPGPADVQEVLSLRLEKVLRGPHIQLQSPDSSVEDNVDTGRKASLRRTAHVISRDGSFLKPISDEQELSMLRSIFRPSFSEESKPKRMESLDIHEYEDVSDEEQLSTTTIKTTKKRKKSLMRQMETQESSVGPSILDSITQEKNSVRRMEDRLSGYRHEKMRSSTKSGEGIEDQLSGLVYDADFDCYYNPSDETYYRLATKVSTEEAKDGGGTCYCNIEGGTE